MSNTVQVFNVTDPAYGATGAGYPTDDTAAIQAAINACASAGGGRVYLPVPSVAYYCAGALYVPTTGTNPTSPPIVFFGDGAPQRGVGDGLTPAGSVLDLRYTGTDGLHPACIDLRGRGRFEMYGLCIYNGGTANWPFIQTTNTSWHIHDCAFIGNQNNSGSTCVQNACVWGGSGYEVTDASMTASSSTLTIGVSDPPFASTMVGWEVQVTGAGPSGATLTTTISAILSATTATLSTSASTTVSGTTAVWGGFFTTDPQAFFQGYGSVARDNVFSRIQIAHSFQGACNSPMIVNEAICGDCGTSLSGTNAPFVVQASPLQGSYGGFIIGGTVEMIHYPYLFSMLQNTAGWQVMMPGSYDNSAGNLVSLVLADATSTGDNAFVVSTWNGGGGPLPPVLSGAGAASNTVISALGVPSVFPTGISVPSFSAPALSATHINGITGGIAIQSVGGNPVVIEGATGYAGLLWLYNAASKVAAEMDAVAAGGTVYASQVVSGTATRVCGLRGDLGGALFLGSFTASTRPATSAATNCLIWGSDQNSGDGALLHSDGSAWRNVGSGAVASP